MKRLAVLPFDNLGSAEDEYFADGVTDEIRGKLAGVQGSRSPPAAARRSTRRATRTWRRSRGSWESDYLFVGKVRWEKGEPGRAGAGEPELIQVATGSTEWEQPFDANLTDVFKVQADVAGQVAGRSTSRSAAERQALAEQPTANAAAYDAYLKGEAASQKLGRATPSAARGDRLLRAGGGARLGIRPGVGGALAGESLLYFNGTPSPERARRAREAAERALRSSPNHFRGISRWATTTARSPRWTTSGRCGEYEAGLRLAPNDIDSSPPAR